MTPEEEAEFARIDKERDVAWRKWEEAVAERDIAMKLLRRMMKEKPTISEVRTAMREVTILLRQIANDPSKLDNFDATQLAWLQEHLEMLRDQSLDLKKRIEDLIHPPVCPQCASVRVTPLELDELLDWWHCQSCQLDFSTV